MGTGEVSGVKGREAWPRALAPRAAFPQGGAGGLGAGAREWPEGEEEGVSRREFLHLMGAGLALAGVGGMGGCYRPPQEKIVPYVTQPEQEVPGQALYFATAMPLFGGIGRGVLVEQHEGRPTKVEGNPDHPESLGGTDVFMQASVLGLYDPERSASVVRRGNDSTWSEFTSLWGEALARMAVRRGGAAKVRVAVLSEASTSPTVGWQWGKIQALFPQAKWYEHEAVGREHERAGALQALGREVATVYDLEKAARIVALDSDFLRVGPGTLRYARQWAQQRRVKFKPQIGPAAARSTEPPPPDPVPTGETMNRLYVVESTVTVTGAKADHRLAVPGREVGAVAQQLAAALRTGQAQGPWAQWVEAVAQDLVEHRGRSVVVVGESQPAWVHALGHRMNAALGAVGQTVRYGTPLDAVAERGRLQELVHVMRGGEVDILLILEGNPAFSAPVDLSFAQALKELSLAEEAGALRNLTVHWGLYQDETAALCQWHIPATHYLETWSDVRAYDGTVSLLQPLIAPLYGGRMIHELLAVPTGETLKSGYELLREYWRAHWPAALGNFEAGWEEALRTGVLQGTASGEVVEQPETALTLSPAMPDTAATPAHSRGGLEIRFCPDPCIYDGRFANNGWLQELPKPLTRLTWDNAALTSFATAAGLGLAVADQLAESTHPIVRLAYRGRTLEMPLLGVPGHPDGVVTVYLGHGRRRAGKVGQGVGMDAYRLRTSEALWFDEGLQIAATQRTSWLAIVQPQQTLQGRDLVRTASIAEVRASKLPRETPDLYATEPESGARRQERKTVHMSLYPEVLYRGYKWGMTIDLTACVGCNACVMACVAENNAPVVGKVEVSRGRAMQWLRIDTYFAAPSASPTATTLSAAHPPEVLFQPMLCQHCENAPCEIVCPVEATSHSDEGVNEMTYNRCVGTRYCSNNCPYKVRRFNFLLYSDYHTEAWKLARNPNVTVRWRGVMEKCTYCVQRINAGRIEVEKAQVEAEAAGKTVALRRVASDGWVSPDPLPALAVVTACQQACPAEAIIFGDLNDSDSFVHRLKTTAPWASLDYGVLTELNTQPRTSYLRRVTNPNPALM